MCRENNTQGVKIKTTDGLSLIVLFHHIFWGDIFWFQIFNDIFLLKRDQNLGTTYD